MAARKKVNQKILLEIRVAREELIQELIDYLERKENVNSYLVGKLKGLLDGCLQDYYDAGV